MNKNLMNCKTKWMIVFGMLIFSFAASGCDLVEEYEKTVRLSQKFRNGNKFEAVTHNGSIRAVGSDGQTVEVFAIITGRGPTIEEAKKIAESIDIKLERKRNVLSPRVITPQLLEARYYNIEYDIQMPSDTRLEFETHNGSIDVEKITGPIRLTTHNGGIECDQVSGRIHVQTHNGGIRIHYDDINTGSLDTVATTHNGSIEVNAHDELSAQIDISTHNGKINVNRQVTVTGEIDNNKLNGCIGTCTGRIFLRTHNGSITLK